MARTPKKSDLDLVLDKIDTEIAALEGMKSRILATRADLQAVAMTPATPRKSHKKKDRTTAAAAPTGI